jgi:autotransporter-associated beta strand protein
MNLKLRQSRAIRFAKVFATSSFITVVLLLPACLNAANVSVTDNGNGTVTMANGLVSMTFSKSDGSVSSFYLAGLPTTNLIDSSQDYALSLTHIGSGTNDYWVSINSPGVPAYTVVTNTGQIVDVMLENPVASGNASLYPNGIWDWAEHHVMRAGEAGFYTYTVWRHHANQPAVYYDADSWQGRLNSMFSSAQNPDGSIYQAWSFSSSDVPVDLSIGGNPPGSTSAGVPGEVVILPYTNYWTQPSGTNYEPGWPAYTQPCGLTSDLHPTWTKYDYSSYQGPTTSARNAWGDSTENVGLWTLLGSAEFINGGPTKLKGAVSGNYMYNDDFEGHGLGSSPAPSAPAGATYTKVIGPYFMYANIGTNHMQLWQDAQNMGALMASNWPYAWMDESEQDYPRHRGTVTGTITAKTGESTVNPVVILGAADAADGDWMYQGASNYLFWTTGDAGGNFSIPKVRPGNYVLFSYVPGIWGELQISNIIVTADLTNNLGVISWNPPHLQQRLWRVGTPDHTSKEFRFGNLPKQFGLWWRYLNERGQNDLNFTIGQSVESNDWYYAQCIMAVTPSGTNLTDHTQTNGIYWGPRWNVIFNLTNLPTSNVLFTLALAGGRGTAFYTYLNGVNATPSPYQSTGYYTTDGANIYRDVVTVGRYQYYQISFAPNLFVVGTNTLSITIRQGGAATTWNIGNVTNGYPDLLSGGLIYDFLQMETGPQVIIASPPAAPSGLKATTISGCEIDLSWTNNATNATSVVIQRSNDGVNFTQIGATANNRTNYSDTSLSPGTTYYYQVVANNADGNAPDSNTAHASTQAAQPPAAPSGLTAAGVATNQVNLTWIDNSGNEDGFNLERSTNGGNYGSVAMVAAGVTNYSDTGLAAGTAYFYRVQAFRSCWGNSAYSDPTSATTSVPSPPAIPAGLVASPGNARVTLTWVASSGAGSYNLKQGTGSGSETFLATTTGTTYTNTGLLNGTTYYYVVSALNAGGESGNSREASATPLPFVNSYWTNRTTSAAQSWDSSANWTNTPAYPNITGIVANVTADITANQTVNVDRNITLGWLNLGDANASSTYTIAPNGGSLTFYNGTNNVAGLVQQSTSAGDTISAPMTISNNLVVVNNSTAHTLTLSGTISGTNSVTFAGSGSVTLTVSNGYTGGTLISGTTVTPANFNADSNAFGSGPITLDQGTLNLHSDTTTYNNYFWNLVVPTNTSGTLNADGRSYMHGTLTGGGTLNFNPPFVRVELDGDWSEFTGQINTSGSDFRVNNTYGLAKTALYLGGDAAYSLNGSMTVGEISGSASATLTTTAWTVGARNSTAVFAGVITGNSVAKVGTGAWILTGNNTYTGSTTINGGAIQIGDGGTSGTLNLNNAYNVTNNAALIFNRYDNIVFAGVISGSGSLTQAGFGVLTLSAASTYSGATCISAGTLALTNSGSIAGSTNINLANGAIFDISGTTSHAMTLSSGKMISGDGQVNGSFIVAGSATLAPGNNDLGSLAFSNSLTLAAGSKTVMSVSHDSQANNAVSVAGTLTLGGSLIVSNADDPEQAGDVFKLFSVTSFAGNFSSITLPVLTPGLYWDTNALNTAGLVRVVMETPPTIGSVGVSGGNLVLRGAGGMTNGTYYVLISTNVAAPLTNWTRLLTNQFDGSGSFNFTNPMMPAAVQNFYLLQLP